MRMVDWCFCVGNIGNDWTKRKSITYIGNGFVRTCMNTERNISNRVFFLLNKVGDELAK